MSGETVVTTLEIDADTSGADQYASAMDRVSDAAQNGVASAQSMVIAIAGVGVAAVAAVAGLRSFIDYVGKQTQALVDMSTHAELAGVSVKEFQQLMFAAMSAGVSEKDFTDGMDRISSDITDASRGVTQFGRLLEANNISLKNQNGQIKTAKDIVGDLANLMAQATPQQQQAIARIVGLSQSWIPFLRQGSDNIDEQKKKAADLGIIIDDSIVAKAKEFNNQWHTAVAAWDLQFKASMASILPLLVQLADLASKVIDGIGGASGAAIRLLTPADQQTTGQLNDTINEVERLTEVMQKYGEQSFVARNLKGSLRNALGLPEDADLNAVYAGLDKLTAKYDQLSARIRVTAKQGAGVNLPDLNSQNDALDRAINSLQKHIEQQKADTEAIGLGDGAMAAFRVSAAETAAVLANNGKETEDQAARFAQLKTDAYDAADALAKAKLAAQIDFAQKTIGLSSEDVQIAQQLASVYGNKIPDALASTQAAQLRYIAQQKQLNDAVVQFGTDFVGGLLRGEDAMKSLTSAAQQLIATLANQNLKRFLQGGSFFGSQDLNSLQGGAAVAGAGLSGYSSGNPLIGALGGALAGATFGPIGAAIGGIAGAVGGLLGQSAQAEAALEQAQAQWKSMTGQVMDFNEAAKGVALGQLVNQLQKLQANDNGKKQEKTDDSVQRRKVA